MAHSRLTRRRFSTIAGAFLLAPLAACGGAKRRPLSVFQGFLSDFARELIVDSPELASLNGFTPAQAYGEYRNRLDNRSARAVDLRRGAALRRRAELEGIDRKRLSQQELITLDTLREHLQVLSVGAQFEYGRFDALRGFSPYVINPLECAAIELPEFFDARCAVRDLAEAEAYVQRLERAPAALDQEVERARADAVSGVVPPSFLLQRTLASVQEHVATPAESSVFIAALRRKLDAAFGPAPADSTQRSTARKRADAVLMRAIAVVSTKLNPAYARTAAAVAALLARATDAAGISHLPQGREYYEAALVYHAGKPITPEQTHALGRKRVAELTAQLDMALRGLGLMEGGVGARLTALSADPAFSYPETEEGRLAALSDARAALKRIQALLPRAFAASPARAIEARAAPSYADANQPGAYYQPASQDGARPALFSLNLRDMRALPKFDVPTLVAHEALPGHHMQVGLQQDNASLSLAQRLISFSAYTEGWALYAEQLADELGFYEGDPYGRIGYLRWRLWRAARLVVDTGLHVFGWTRAQAIAYLTDLVGDSPGLASAEVDRYCAWPGQACAYEIGALEFSAAREEARAARGRAFDIKEFHALVLQHGPIALPVMRALAASWAHKKAYA